MAHHYHIIGNNVVLMGDHTKIGYESKRSPGISKMRQDSKDQANPSISAGRMAGLAGILPAGPFGAFACIPPASGAHGAASIIRVMGQVLSETFKGELPAEESLKRKPKPGFSREGGVSRILRVALAQRLRRRNWVRCAF
jgi:hypothetical protein